MAWIIVLVRISKFLWDATGQKRNSTCRSGTQHFLGSRNKSMNEARFRLLKFISGVSGQNSAKKLLILAVWNYELHFVWARKKSIIVTSGSDSKFLLGQQWRVQKSFDCGCGNKGKNDSLEELLNNCWVPQQNEFNTFWIWFHGNVNQIL